MARWRSLIIIATIIHRRKSPWKFVNNNSMRSSFVHRKTLFFLQFQHSTQTIRFLGYNKFLFTTLSFFLSLNMKCVNLLFIFVTFVTLTRFSSQGERANIVNLQPRLNTSNIAAFKWHKCFKKTNFFKLSEKASSSITNCVRKYGGMEWSTTSSRQASERRKNWDCVLL